MAPPPSLLRRRTAGLAAAIAFLAVLAWSAGPTIAVPGPSAAASALGTAYPASGLRPFVTAEFALTVFERGLPNGTAWGVSVDGTALTSVGPNVSLLEPDGAHVVAVDRVAGYQPDPGFAELVVSGAATNLTVNFTAGPVLPFTTGQAPALVLGQPNFTAVGYSSAVNRSTVLPWLNAFDAHGDLWVSDLLGNRVLEFVPPFHDGMNASLVLGQSNFTNSAPGLNASNLSRPEGLLFDSAGDLWVASEGSDRVSEFRPPFSDGMNASLVLGQSVWGADVPHAVGPANLSEPVGIALDGSGDLWVAEFGNNRVVEFRPPFVTGENVSIVLGQSTLYGNEGGLTAVNLSNPQAIAFDAHGDAWVADWSNSRVVEYRAPITTGEAASVVLGQRNFTSDNATGPNSLVWAAAVALDSHGNVWVADFGHSRVVEFVAPTFTDFQAPALVIGEPNASTFGSPVDSMAILAPQGLAFDSAGNLWIDDTSHGRVLEFLAAPSSSSSNAAPLPWTAVGLGLAVGVVAVAAVLLLRRRGRPRTAPTGGPTPWTATGGPAGSPSGDRPGREAPGGPPPGAL